MKMDFQTMRTYGSIAVILGCFIFLYPKLLHPIVMTMFGMNSKAETKDTHDFIPPALRDRHPEMGKHAAGDMADSVRKMRHGPHPGMRAAATEQSKTTKGSGRSGMMGVILPLYAVGIVLYLVYTLFKVFGGKGDKKGNQRDSRSPSREPPRVTSQGSPPGGNEEEVDMRKLQERLAETEAQMSQILAAMQMVQTKVGKVTTEATGEEVAGKTTVSEKDSSNNQGNEQNKEADNSDLSGESTQESESYEMVNKSDKECNSEGETGNIETLQSTTSQESPDTEVTDETEEEEVEEVLLDDLTKSEPDDTSNVRKRVAKSSDS